MQIDREIDSQKHAGVAFYRLDEGKGERVKGGLGGKERRVGRGGGDAENE